jgi:hypothetical protein
MNPTTVQMEQKEEEILSFEVSDEVLESAGQRPEMATTFFICTGLLICPSPDLALYWARNLERPHCRTNRIVSFRSR